MKSRKELEDALLKAHLVRASNDGDSGGYYLGEAAHHWIRVLNWVLETPERGSMKRFSDFGQELEEHVKEIIE